MVQIETLPASAVHVSRNVSYHNLLHFCIVDRCLQLHHMLYQNHEKTELAYRVTRAAQLMQESGYLLGLIEVNLASWPRMCTGTRVCTV